MWKFATVKCDVMSYEWSIGKGVYDFPHQDRCMCQSFCDDQSLQKFMSPNVPNKWGQKKSWTTAPKWTCSFQESITATQARDQVGSSILMYIQRYVALWIGQSMIKPAKMMCSNAYIDAEKKENATKVKEFILVMETFCWNDVSCSILQDVET